MKAFHGRRADCGVQSRLLYISLLIAVVLLATTLGVGAQSVSGDILGLAGFAPSLIEVERGESRIVLEKDGAGWMLIEPVVDQADQAAVESLLGRLSNLTVADVLQGDPDRFGLDHPQAKVRLVNGAGEARELLIGDLRSPVSLFVAPAGSNVVYAVSNVSLSRLGQNPAAFLDTRLLAVDPAEVVAYEVFIMPEVQERPVVEPEAPSAAGAVSETGALEDAEVEPIVYAAALRDGVWLTEDETVAFDVDGFLRSVRLVQAADRALAGYDHAFYPAPGTAKITLRLRDGRTVQVDVGVATEDGKYHFVRTSERDEVYLVPRFQAAHVVGQAQRINDSLLTIDPDRVAQLTISIGPGGQEVVYRRNNNGLWESNRAIVFNFTPLLDAINSVEARRAASTLSDPAAYGFETAERSVRAEIRFTDNNSLTLMIGGPTAQGDGVYVSTSERQGVYAGVESSVDALIQAAGAVRSRLFPLDASRVTAVELIQVSGSGEEAAVRWTKDGDRWSFGDRTVENNVVTNLLDQIGQLSADDLPQPPDDPDELAFYPAPQSRRVIVEFDDGSQRFLDIGGQVEVGSGWFATVNYYVQVSDLDDLTFVREQTLRRVFQAMDALR